MTAEKNSIESILRALATLEPTIEALLKNNTPRSPIVQQKIEQAELVIYYMPLELEPIASNWRAKLAKWWVEFATQQVPFLLPREEELKMIIPSPLSIRSIIDSGDVTKGSSNVTKGYCEGTKGSGDVTKCFFDVTKVSCDVTKGSDDVTKSSGDVTKGSFDETKGSGGGQQAPTVSESEPIIEPVPDDFDWASPPENPMHLNPYATQNRAYNAGSRNFNRY